MGHLQTVCKPLPDRMLPGNAASQSLWSELTPVQRQQWAQGLAELIQRMRQSRLPSPTESNHDHI
jgi:hypothetical protein